MDAPKTPAEAFGTAMGLIEVMKAKLVEQPRTLKAFVEIQSEDAIAMTRLMCEIIEALGDVMPAVLVSDESDERDVRIDPGRARAEKEPDLAAVANGAEQSRRAAWAKYYQAAEELEDLKRRVEMLKDDRDEYRLKLLDDPVEYWTHVWCRMRGIPVTPSILRNMRPKVAARIEEIGEPTREGLRQALAANSNSPECWGRS